MSTDYPKLSAAQRQALYGPLGGGLPGWLTRLRADHWPTFAKSRRELIYAGCSCGDVRCSAPLFLVHIDDLIDAYEAKVGDLAAETARSSGDQGDTPAEPTKPESQRPIVSKIHAGWVHVEDGSPCYGARCARCNPVPSAPVLPEPDGLDLTAFQTEVWEASQRLFPDRCDPRSRALKFAEEAGEVVGAVIKRDEGRKTLDDIAAEIADATIVLASLCSSLGLDYASVIGRWWSVALAKQLGRAASSPGVEAEPDEGIGTTAWDLLVDLITQAAWKDAPCPWCDGLGDDHDPEPCEWLRASEWIKADPQPVRASDVPVPTPADDEFDGVRYYVARCAGCEIDVPFDHAQARNDWGAEHAIDTGHTVTLGRGTCREDFIPIARDAGSGTP